MNQITNDSVVSADGEYSLYNVQPGKEVVVEWDASAGSATIQPGYEGRNGTFRAHKLIDGSDPSFAAGYGIIRMDVPASGRCAIKVTGAAGLTMKVSQTVVPA